MTLRHLPLAPRPLADLQAEVATTFVEFEILSALARAPGRVFTRDMLLTLFSSKTFADVRTPQGKAVLREEIVNRMNTVLNEDAVKAIYFTEFIVQ